MTHWIVERMHFEQKYGRRRPAYRYDCGMRVSCDDGVSWVVAGTVHFDSGDTFSDVDRWVSAQEFAWRCQRPRVLRFELPPRPGIGSAATCAQP